MIICSALYYPGSLARGDLIVRDNRFYPGKYSETLPVWWQYLRRCFPDVKVVLFVDVHSPIRWGDAIGKHIQEQTRVVLGHPENTLPLAEPVTIVPLRDHPGYFRPMQRNLVEGINLAYRMQEDLLWLDNDAFLNTDIRPLIGDGDVVNSNIEHHQQTMGSICFYLSRARLHALDGLCHLPTYLTNMLENGPTETRMHSLQEGGLYKLFCYGKAREVGPQIQLAHLSCYDHFMTFLERNPLDTQEYRWLVDQLRGFDFGRIPGVERTFHDMIYPHP